jgi:hypothetical protein
MAEVTNDNEGVGNGSWFQSGIFTYFEFDSIAVSSAKSTDNVKGKCKLCLKYKRASISGRVRISSNFVKHVRVSHHSSVIIIIFQFIRNFNFVFFVVLQCLLLILFHTILCFT